MKPKRPSISAGIFFGLFLFAFSALAQDSVTVIQPRIAKYDYDAIPKDPLASAFFSATIPGSGQAYNKEYFRGGITAVGFYAGLLTTQYMIQRWQSLNTDTFYVAEAYGTHVRRITVPKPADSQVGLPNDEKAVLAVSALAVAGFYVWGIVDSYRGAQRYNQKLISAFSQPLELRFAVYTGEIGMSVETRLRF